MRFYFYLFVICSNFLLVHPEIVYGWTPGEFVFEIDYLKYQTSHFWNKNGKKMPAFNHFDQNQYSFYLEYNPSRNDVVSWQGAYNRIEESVNGRTLGFSDSELIWKHYVYSCHSKYAALELRGIIPIGYSYKPGLRYGRPGIQLSGIFLQYLHPFGHQLWYQTRLGFRTYQGFPSDQIRADVIAGYEVAQNLQIIAATYLDYGLFNGTFRADRNMIAFDPNYRLLQAEMHALYYLNRWSYCAVGYFRHLWGNNVGTGGGWFGSLGVHF